MISRPVVNVPRLWHNPLAENAGFFVQFPILTWHLVFRNASSIRIFGKWIVTYVGSRSCFLNLNYQNDNPGLQMYFPFLLNMIRNCFTSLFWQKSSKINFEHWHLVIRLDWPGVFLYSFHTRFLNFLVWNFVTLVCIFATKYR